MNVILDACCGSRSMYKGMDKRLEDNFIYIDVRKQEGMNYGKHTVYHDAIQPIKPLIMADMQYLPFKDNLFSAIICDPPHLEEGLGSFMGIKYGVWSKREVIYTMRQANIEFKRVLQPNGILILKIFSSKQVVYEALLTNFTFFLPIEHKSKSNLSREKIGWYVATLKGSSQTEPSADGSDTQDSPKPPILEK